MAVPLIIPVKEIEVVTDNFADANFIGEGFLGKIYKAQLTLEGEPVDVAVRRLDHSFWLQELAFEKEISVLSRLKHENMVSIVGYSFDNNEMLIINERVTRGSLSRRLSDRELTWMIRLQISVGAVRALSYLHSYGIIHHNININTILLDENWEAKISGFEYSMTIPSRNLDLAYEKLGMGTYKSDVMSIGIVLFELLCSREAFVSKEDNSFQASSAIFQYENRDLHKFVDQNLFNQMDPLSFNIFSKTTYDCLIQQRAPPTMNEILNRLERALAVKQMYENNERSKIALHTIPDHLKLKLESLKHMRIPLDDILAATDKFSKGCIVSSGGFGSVYVVELEHVEREYCLAIKRENKSQVPKKRSMVSIKNIEDTEDEIAIQGFYAEIETLTSCKLSNIITLVGFCDQCGTMILIYEFASNGNLSYYLQNMKNNLNDGWAQRLKICLDAAKGLSFLHTTDGDLREVVHRDIKSANILLDENLTAKIGDFGLSIFPSVGEEHYNTKYARNVVGTLMYMDPQYIKDAKLKKQI
ncbi:receptor-like protein kinase FERONIA [Bidens hawaiensis]|uniref:receptor-like protein kinase FERONIA n=1 Tax=Bidens hawaiensis TaxID=980011 RepID=UPI00404A5564